MPARLENIAEKVISCQLNAASAAKSRTHFGDVRYARRHTLTKQDFFRSLRKPRPFKP
jgi:hypothetical protein